MDILRLKNKIESKLKTNKKMTVILKHEKSFFAKRFLSYLAKDPTFQGLVKLIGMFGSIVTIISFGSQLQGSSPETQSPEQTKTALEQLSGRLDTLAEKASAHEKELEKQHNEIIKNNHKIDELKVQRNRAYILLGVGCFFCCGVILFVISGPAAVPVLEFH